MIKNLIIFFKIYNKLTFSVGKLFSEKRLFQFFVKYMWVFSEYKIYINYIIIAIIIFFWVSFVFGSNVIFEPKLGIKKISNNIFIWVENLNKDLLVFNSDIDLSKYSLSTWCEINSKYLWKKNNDYYFAFSYKNNCKNPNIYLKNEDWVIIKKSLVKINIFSERKIFDYFSDTNLSLLEKFNKKLKNSINKLKIKVKSFWKEKENFNIIKIKRILEENIFKQKILQKIINWKKDKYRNPVVWHKMPKQLSKIPNSSRWYRENYTDWIHHGWDIYWYYWEDVVAIDDWIIVRIVDNFEFENLSNIKKWNNITNFDKIKNLDLLRWNQVWLKTTKWDIVFYSHLSKIYSNIKVWDIVSRGQKLWAIWISWVPYKNYKDYHLHFAIMKNPLNIKKIGKYEIDDYFKWDWYFKWKSLDYVLNHQDEVFYN